MSYLYQEGQRWVNNKWDVYVKAVKAVEEDCRVTLHFPRNGETHTVSSATFDDYINKFRLRIDPRTITNTFDDIFEFLVSVPYKERAALIVRLRQLLMLSDDEFEHVILSQLSADDGEAVYKALGLEPYAWPLRAPEAGEGKGRGNKR